jgi:hypothetical protein
MIASRKRSIEEGRIPANLPVSLYLTRVHQDIQGISGSYRKFIGFRPNASLWKTLWKTHAVVRRPAGHPKALGT